MKHINKLYKATLGMIASMMVIGCAAPNSTGTAYQNKTKPVLQRFASNVSRGFTGNRSSGRGIAYDYSYGYQQTQSYAQQPYGGALISQAMEQELEACTEIVNNVPPTCDNYGFMISSLARCLDRIITYRNPILTYAFKNLDNRGQQYWSYLLNYRRPQSFDLFLGGQDYSAMYNYASQGGYYPGGYGYGY